MARFGGRIGLHQQRKAGPIYAVADSGLGAVDHVMVAIASGIGTDCLQVSAAIGLGQCQPAAQFPRGKPRQEPALLRLGSMPWHDRRHNQVGVEGSCQRHPYPRDAFDNSYVRCTSQPKPTVFGLNCRTEEAKLAHAGNDRFRLGIGLLEHTNMRRNVAREEPIDRLQDQGVSHGPARTA